MKIKVCGLNDPQNITGVAALKPDFMGFIFHEASPRFLTATIPEIHPAIIKVGVFVDADEHYIRAKMTGHQLQAIQFHGFEPPELLARLRGEYLIIKAFSIGEQFHFTALKPFEPVADYFLFDTKGAQPGGNGVAFDWQILKQYQGDTPFFLSGGIGANDAAAIQNCGLPIFALDVNSKFETRPGHKDLSLIQQFKTKLSHVSNR